jgi:DtxR family transcriptional regulator, Mn-dependent transcriptional regulator
MKINETAQEQLEYLWMASQEGLVGKSPLLPNNPAVAQAPEDYQALIQMGLVTQDGNGAALTETGKIEAAMAIRRHRLAERLLTDVLVTEEAVMDERACSLEHALFDGVDESICTLLGHPQTCPHGKPIPPGECCKQMRATAERLIAPLNELKPDQEGSIAYIQMKNPQHLQKLMAMGVLPGVSFHVTSIYPSYVFEAGFSQFAVDEEIAADIYVRLRPQSNHNHS